MADMMEQVLRRVEQEQGTSLLAQASWDELGDYVKCVEGTIVSQKDLGDLLSLLQNTPQTSAPVVETSFSEDQEPFPASETDDRYNSSGTNLQPETSIPGSHLHPRHHSSVHSRSRGPGIRKISLSESSQYRPYHSRASHGSLDDELDLDDGEYRVPFSRVSPFICLDARHLVDTWQFFQLPVFKILWGSQSCKELSGCDLN